MKKLGGYALMILGAVLLVGSSALVKVSFLQNISKNIVIIIGIVLMAVGFFLTLSKKQKKQLEEVPIYEGQGEKIVGYRRHGKK
jgi:hypothetical protein